MAKKKTLLEQLRANPRGDWRIADIEKLCNQVGLTVEPPKHGSHFKIFSDNLRDVLTIPARRPIKPPYIRNIVNYADAHIAQSEQGDDDE